MNALLIYPSFPDTFWSLKHALKFIRKRAASPPLGLLTIAAMLPGEWAKRVVDLNVRLLRKKDLAWADMVFISGMAVQRDCAYRIVHQCKEAGVPVVAGGPLFTHEHMLFPEVDHFVLNEAEITLPPFLEDLKKGRLKRVYSTSEFPELSQTPVPLWELADLKRYATMSIQYSRGCPFNCEFCNVTMLFGHRPRIKSSRQVIAELDSLFEHGWRGNVFFVDDNFIGNKRKLKSDLLPALINWQKRHKGVTFNTEVSINLADDENLMKMMVEAGFHSVFVGIETPDEVGLAECSKKQNSNRDLVADVKRIQRAGLEVQAGFIVGFDSDTPSIFQRQIDFIQTSGIVTAMVGLLQAIPGTRLYERLKKEDRLVGISTGDNVDGTCNIVTRMDTETLKNGYKSILQYIYAPRNYYQRVRTFLREFKTPQIRGRVGLGEVLALARTTVRLGIFGKERFHYWKLIAWTIFRRPKLLAQAVTLAVYGYHFRRICELHVL